MRYEDEDLPINYQHELKRKDRYEDAKLAEKLIEILKFLRSLRLLGVLCVKKKSLS